MAVEPLILVVNPGSASRKYALFKGDKKLAAVHIEVVDNTLVANTKTRGTFNSFSVGFNALQESSDNILNILGQMSSLKNGQNIDALAIRVVAPSAHFLEDRLITDYEIKQLESVREIAPIHIGATLDEIKKLKNVFSDVPMYGVSDSAFHITKPDYAWNYAINLDDADGYDIKRFGYHGISVSSVVGQLWNSRYGIPQKTIVAHIGSGVSVTALFDGISVDNSMGYSPLDGVMMSTRSGSIDLTAAISLANKKGITVEGLEQELNSKSGLLGISGSSSDVKQLLAQESHGDYRASLALSMYVYRLRQMISAMAASLQGVDALVFTGTVGQRSFPIRQRIIEGLGYLNLVVDINQNNRWSEIEDKIVSIHPRTRSKPILILPANEDQVIANRAITMMA